MSNEEFNRLIDRYLAGQTTVEETRLMIAFLEHQEQKKSVPDPTVSEALWQSIAAAIEAEPVAVPGSHAWRGYAIVACSLMVVAIFGYFGYHEYARKASELITKNAPYGEKSIITLTDGSKVFLNSGSSISFPRNFDKSAREITLTGEAFFEVTRNPRQPFIVRTGDLITRVLGTSFNIQAFDANDISVSVATGRVQVTQGSNDGVSQSGNSQTIYLEPSQQVSYQNHHFTLSFVDIEKTISWKNNTLRFDETPMSAVGSILSRWYDVDISFDNNDIVNCRINGQFKGQRLEEVLRSIRYMYNIEYEIITPNKIILYGKGCKN
ncbi:MAG TPA: FecR domain-containing protein [Chryseolinea sp.]|nr:FecR domain-containing protein [Chryseolinea sp.]